MHSYGRLIPINFLVTEPEQIEGPDGVGRVNCTTPRAAGSFQTSLKDAVTEDINVNPNLYQIRNGNTATLIVNNIRRNFKNRKIYYNSLSHFFFLQISGQSEWTRLTSTHSFTVLQHPHTCIQVLIHATIIAIQLLLFVHVDTCINVEILHMYT